MSEYADGDPYINYDDSGTMQTTDTVAAMNDDDTGPGLDIAASIHLQLCKVNDKLDAQLRDAACKEQARLDSQPNVLPLTQLITFTAAANPQVVSFGSPTRGRQWNVLALLDIPQGKDVAATSAVAANIAWYVGVPPQTGNIPTTLGAQLRHFRQNSTGFPERDKIGPHEIVVSANETLYAVITNVTGAGAAGQNWLVTAVVGDEPVKGSKSTVET